MQVKRLEGKGQYTLRKVRQADPNRVGAQVGAP